MSSPTNNDKLALSLIQCPDGSFAQQVQVKDTGTATDKIDTEIQLLCDKGNGDTKFYGIIQYDDQGVLSATATIDLNGGAYSVVGPIEVCAAENAKTVITDACDELADGSRVRFYYLHTVQAGSIISSIPINASGAAYTIVNEIPEEKSPLVDDIEVSAHELCDSGNNNEAYLLTNFHNTVTGVTTSVTTTLDGQTAYTPVTPAVFKDDCFMFKSWVIDKSTASLGVVEKYWDQNGSAITGSDSVPLAQSVFTNLDECDLPQHPGDATPDQTNILSQAITTDPLTAVFAHQSQLDFYIVVDEPVANVRIRTQGNSRVLTYFSVCNEKLQLVDEYEHTTGAGGIEFTDLGQLSSGIYKIRVYQGDLSGTRGQAFLEWSLDSGVNYSLVPADNLYQSFPRPACRDLIYNKTEKKYFDTDGNEIDNGFITLTCDPCQNSVEVFQQTAVGEVLDFHVNVIDACDQLADGSIQRFYYEVKFENNLEVSRNSVNADGSPYIIINEVPEKKKEVHAVSHNRGTGPLTVSAPFTCFSITAYSDDVVINGQSVNEGQTINLQKGCYSTDQVIDGTDYFVTVVN